MIKKKLVLYNNLKNISGGKIVRWDSAGPFTLYKNTKTGNITYRQTSSTSAWTQKTVADGWAKSFHL
jgi:hypothetical protein